MRGKSNITLFCFGGIITIWLALLIAPNLNGGLIGIINNLPKKLSNPFNIEFCKDSIKTIFIFWFLILLE